MRNLFSMTTPSIGCSIREVFSLYNNYPDDVLGPTFINTIGKTLKEKGNLAYLFSDVVAPPRGGKGATIAKWLVDHKMGSVTESPTFNNGNYGMVGSEIKIWTFLPDYKVAKPFYDKLVAEEKVVGKVA